MISSLQNITAQSTSKFKTAATKFLQLGVKNSHKSNAKYYNHKSCKIQYRSLSDSTSDRLHSTDIAFKPAESGWGSSSKYGANYDSIFGGNKKGGVSSSSSNSNTHSSTPSTTSNTNSVKNNDESKNT